MSNRNKPSLVPITIVLVAIFGAALLFIWQMVSAAVCTG